MVFLLTSCNKLAELQNDRAIAAYSAGDHATAIDIWEPLAQQGNARAQNNLGVMYSEGQVVDRNVETALEWFRLAADQGFVLAMANIADTYFRGDGIAQDYVLAEQWYRMAAKGGDSEAQYFMGRIFVEGLGVTADPLQGYAWYAIAADSGEERAIRAREELESQFDTSQRAQADKRLAQCLATALKEC